MLIFKNEKINHWKISVNQFSMVFQYIISTLNNQNKVKTKQKWTTKTVTQTMRNLIYLKLTVYEV